MSIRTIVYISIITTCFFTGCKTEQASPRTTLDFNFDWRFSRGDIENAQSVDFNDTQWKSIRLPHDWSVGEAFTQDEGAAATAFLPGGIGWYRKTFYLPEEASMKKTWIEFDGIYNNSTVWLNGHELGHHPYGYSPFSYDLSPYLNYSKKANVIAVKADRSAFVDCRWYPGSGIYRNVKLVSVNSIHIPKWGTFISTPVVNVENAEIHIINRVKNGLLSDTSISIKVIIKNNQNNIITQKIKTLKISAGNIAESNHIIELKNPNLWDTDNPNLYTAICQIISNEKLIDESVTVFGIREIRFDANSGFFLNGVHTLIKGVCLHHDGGLVGAAVPDGVWERRLTLLKEAGCNAIRTAHNPPSEAFLDLCDRIGFLVQDEAFDEFDNPKDKRNNFNQEKSEMATRGYTEHFAEWAETDIKAMVLRDRNHPSVIMWSLGNEIEWTYPRYGNSTGYWGANKPRPDINYYWDEPPLSIDKMKKLFYSADSGKHELATTAKRLAGWVREVDTTHPVSANLVIPSVSHFSGYTDALDIVGYSYRAVVYDYGHKNYPGKMIFGSENFPRWHEWKAILDRPFIPGIFIWTGIGYLGESGRWPSHGGGEGLINLAGFKNPSYYHFKGFWSNEPTLYITTQLLDKSPYQWNDEKKCLEEKSPGWWCRQMWGWQDVNEYWDYPENEPIAVEVYTNCSQVELLLNDKSLGIRNLEDEEDRILKWMVPYTDGKLIARGTMANGIRIEELLKSAGQPAKIQLSSDQVQIKADNYDVVHIVAQLVDANGTPVKTEEQRVTFEVEGNCRILGVDNGSSDNIEGFNSNTVITNHGKCLLIIQSNNMPGQVKVKAMGKEGIESGSLTVLLKEEV